MRGIAMVTRRRWWLALSAILLLLLASAVGCTGSSEPAATPTATLPVTSEPAATPTATLPVTSVGAATATATATRSNPIDISFGEHTLTEGAYRYSSPIKTVLFDVPAGLRLRFEERRVATVPTGATFVFMLWFEDLDSGSWISIDSQSRREGAGWMDPARGDIRALFDELKRSVRTVSTNEPRVSDSRNTGGELPPWWRVSGLDPAARAEAEAARRLAVAAAPPRDISGWQFGRRGEGYRLYPGLYRFALNPDEQPLIFEVPEGLSPRITWTGYMGGGQWCPGLRLVEWRAEGGYWADAWLCLDVHRAVELSRSTKVAQRFGPVVDYGSRLEALVASLRLGSVPSPDDPAPCAPLIEVHPDDYQTLLPGGATYLWGRTGTGRFVTIDVPVGVTLVGTFARGIQQPDGSLVSDTLELTEASSGSRLVIDVGTGGERERQLLDVPEPYKLDPDAAFDQILASLRLDEFPAIPGCPAPVAFTMGEGVYRYHMNTSYPTSAVGVPDITFDVPAGLQLKLVSLAVGFWQIALIDAETTSEDASWICLDAELVAECGRWIKPGDEHIGPLFDELSESLRPGTAP